MTLPQRQVSATARCAYSVEKATEPSDEPEPEPEQLTRVESALLSRALTCEIRLWRWGTREERDAKHELGDPHLGRKPDFFR